MDAMPRQTTLTEFAAECHVSLRKLQKEVKAGLLQITRVGKTPFVTGEQKATYLIKKREGEPPRLTYNEQKELEQMGFVGGCND